MSNPKSLKKTLSKDDVAIRFAGDSGDGMQLTGTQFTITSAILGNDIATFPDFPAEIRAPAGTVAGVSGFQVHFSNHDIHTPGDSPDVLVAMNPAALKANIDDLRQGGILIINSDSFTEQGFKKADYAGDPRETIEHGDLKETYQYFEVPVTSLTAEALKETGLNAKAIDRCKNFFALGLCYWLYSRDLKPTEDWVKSKFAKKPEIVEANLKALQAGYNYGDITEAFAEHYEIKPAKTAPGKYRNITGNSALVLGALAAKEKSGLGLFLGSYPITPASDILHDLSKHKNFGVHTFQAEDEIAGICSAIGAAFAGSLAMTTSSGPGIALKQEALGLAVMTELPLVVINIQRGGPSTGLPTKTEQADLYQAMYGRNGESPCIILAASSPGDCFYTMYEAFRLAAKHMTPVMLLSDGYIANGSEPWLIPDVSALPEFEVNQITKANAAEHNGAGDGKDNGAKFKPYIRDLLLARPWAVPGAAGFEHRIGGIESEMDTGNVSYDPDNHFNMVKIRQEKVLKVQEEMPEMEIYGDANAKVCLLGWGSTFGALTAAREGLKNNEGIDVAQMHLRYINPFPGDLKDKLSRFETVIIPEMNMGQLATIIRGQLGATNIESYPQVTGQPFKIENIVAKVKEYL